MNPIDQPFNLTLLQADEKLVSNLRPVTVSDIMQSSGEKLGPIHLIEDKKLNWNKQDTVSSNFHDQGLFSIEIFGRLGEERRDKQFSYVDIRVEVFHPLIFKILSQLKGLYQGILSGKQYARFDEETKDFVASNEEEGETGYQFFVGRWKDIQFQRTNSKKRDEKIRFIEKHKDKAMNRRILVMPAGLRDVRVSSTKRLETPEINDFYRRIVSISNTVFTSNEKTTSPALNYSRYQLQIAFNELYAYINNFLSGKEGYAQKRWSKRAVFNGTLNVISAMDGSRPRLGDKHAPRTTETIVGLYQLMKGIMPKTVYFLRTGYLADIFGIEENSTQAQLIDRDTLKRTTVDLPIQTKDRWTTLDGIEKIVNSYSDIENRHRPILVEGYYLALIYKGPDQTFRVFHGIDELPEGYSRKYVSPITLVELLYLSGYRFWNQAKVIVTRYPVAGLGSTFPSSIYVKTSVNGEQRRELGEDWKPIGEDYLAQEFPTRNPDAFVNSFVVSPVRLKGLVGDYDGDTCMGDFLYSDDAIEEINKTLGSREAYVSPDGSLRTSVGSIDTLKHVLINMTGDMPITN